MNVAYIEDNNQDKEYHAKSHDNLTHKVQGHPMEHLLKMHVYTMFIVLRFENGPIGSLVHIDPVARLENFLTLKSKSLKENFRALKLSWLENFRALKLSILVRIN